MYFLCISFTIYCKNLARCARRRRRGDISVFGRRPDATPVRDLSRLRAFMPFVSPRRNDSTFYMFQDVEVDAALEYLEKKNRGRPQ